MIPVGHDGPEETWFPRERHPDRHRGGNEWRHLMDLLDEDALRAEFSQFRRSEERYAHSFQALVYTAGVRYLAERCRVAGLIDVIAAWQPQALRDPDLQVFQLWELRIKGTRGVAICSGLGERGVRAAPRESRLGAGLHQFVRRPRRAHAALRALAPSKPKQGSAVGEAVFFLPGNSGMGREPQEKEIRPERKSQTSGVSHAICSTPPAQKARGFFYRGPEFQTESSRCCRACAR